MRTAPSFPPRDPEFDRPTRDGPRLRENAVVYYQRLVVNPFLSVVALTGSGLLLGWLAPESDLTWVPPIVFVTVISCYLSIQWHCLDCGATGTFHRWRRHVCPNVWERSRRSNPAWLQFPSASAQLAFWIFVVFIVGSLIMLLRKSF